MSLKLKLVGILSALLLTACGGENESKLGEAIESTKEATSGAVDAVKEGAGDAASDTVDAAKEKADELTNGGDAQKSGEEASGAVEPATESPAEMKDDAVDQARDTK